MKHLKRIAICLWILTALNLAITLLPRIGIDFHYSHSGDSMLPTIKDTDLLVVSSRVPFSELQVGDIVVYKEFETEQMSRYWKAGEEPKAREENKYKENLILHRIVEKTEEGYILKGDHNEGADPGVLDEEGYVGKMVLRIPLLGWFFQHHGPVFIVWFAAALTVVCVIVWVRKQLAMYRE